LVKIDEIDRQQPIVSNLNPPLKCTVSSYEWHPNDNYKLKYIQNVCKGEFPSFFFFNWDLFREIKLLN
jgi:hypothetical protein